MAGRGVDHGEVAGAHGRRFEFRARCFKRTPPFAQMRARVRIHSAADAGDRSGRARSQSGLAGAAPPRSVHLLGAGGAGSPASRAHARGPRAPHHRARPRGLAVLGRGPAEAGVQIGSGASADGAPAQTRSRVVRSAAVSGRMISAVAAARDHGIEVTGERAASADAPGSTHGVAVAGTHGKTTTMTLHGALANGRAGGGALVGGLHRDHGVNAAVPDPGGWFAVEWVREHDRSFLQIRAKDGGDRRPRGGPPRPLRLLRRAESGPSAAS